MHDRDTDKNSHIYVIPVQVMYSVHNPIAIQQHLAQNFNTDCKSFPASCYLPPIAFHKFFIAESHGLMIFLKSPSLIDPSESCWCIGSMRCWL